MVALDQTQVCEISQASINSSSVTLGHSQTQTLQSWGWGDTYWLFTGSSEAVRPKMILKLDQPLETGDLISQSLRRTEEGNYVQSFLPSSSTLDPNDIPKLSGYGHSVQGTSLDNPVFISDSSRDISRDSSPSSSSSSLFNPDQSTSTQEPLSSGSSIELLFWRTQTEL